VGENFARHRIIVFKFRHEITRRQPELSIEPTPVGL
jgi:hypothetical protein